MEILKQKRCIIGEGPIWNEAEGSLYYTNGFGDEICIYNFKSKKFRTHPLDKSCAAIAFGKKGEVYISQSDGVFRLLPNGGLSEIYNRGKYEIRYANDMKAGPDGRLYVGTQSSKRWGDGVEVDGKLYSIDKEGEVRLLLDGLILSNGMEWSADGKLFYHTDSDTGIIKEYYFYAEEGKIEPTGREAKFSGVDGFTADVEDRLYVTRWGGGEVVVFNTKKWETEEIIPLPVGAPSSCCFSGEDLKVLAITSASFERDIKNDENAGYTVLIEREIGGKAPFYFG